MSLADFIEDDVNDKLGALKSAFAVEEEEDEDDENEPETVSTGEVTKPGKKDI
jgi:hypothetical protein